MEGKLPVQNIAAEAKNIIIEHFGYFLKIGIPFLCVLLSSYFIKEFILFQNSDNLTEMLINFGVSISFGITLIVAVISVHQKVLISTNGNDKVFNITGNELRYFCWLFVIYFVVSILQIPVNLIVLNVLLVNEPEFKSIANIFIQSINIVIFYIVSRWSLVLPSAAISQHGRTLIWSWRITKHNGLRLTLLISGPMFMLGLLPDIDSMLYNLVYWVLWVLLGLFEIVCLSLSYRFLTQREE